jgi:hypothetical protein
MTTETFPVSVYFKVNNILYENKNEILDPIITISVNDVKYKENVILNQPINVQPKVHSEYHSGELVEVKFNLDIDDDVDQDIKLSIKLDNENIPLHDEWGIYVTDIELNEISVENLVHENGILDVPLCKEEDYADDGFIQSYLIPEGLDKDLQLIDGRYHYITNGDYLHMEESSYSFTFKTPLYLWLLELLLQ